MNPSYTPGFKDGYLDCSHLTELKDMYITEKKKKKTIQIIGI